MLATRVCSTSWDLARHPSARDTEKAALGLLSATATSRQLWEPVERCNSWDGFDTHSPSFWQLDSSFGFKPAASGALEGESTQSTLREQEQPEHGWPGACDQ